MHVTAAQPTNLESVPASSATNQQSSTLEASTATTTAESGSNSNTSCNNKKTTAASGKRQQQRQHGNLDDEVRSGILVSFSLIDLLIKSLLVRSLLLIPSPCLEMGSTKDQSWLNSAPKSVRDDSCKMFKWRTSERRLKRFEAQSRATEEVESSRLDLTSTQDEITFRWFNGKFFFPLTCFFFVIFFKHLMGHTRQAEKEEDASGRYAK